MNDAADSIPITREILTRRQLFAKSAALAAIGSFGSFAGGVKAANVGESEFWNAPRSVWLTRPESGEAFRGVYWANGQLVRSNFLQICSLLRDVELEKLTRSGRAPEGLVSAVEMDLRLLDVLYAINGWLRAFGEDRPLVIKSGFRNAWRNAKVEGAAMNSTHTFGKGVDLVIPGVSSLQVAKFGVWLQGGGVGWYATKGHTHVDSDRIRKWAA